MLSGLLEKEDCKNCKLCCRFDEYEVWEVPVFTEYEMNKIKEFNKDAEFIKWGNIYRFKIVPLHNGELMSCPALTDTGCVLGAEKPFECAVWPFRIMELDNEKFVCIASFCESMFQKPLKSIIDFLIEDGVAYKIFNYAYIYPDIVKPFNDLYIPLISQRNPLLKPVFEEE
ncbi:MAG: hypothetical protein LBM93_13860 [Oscillospiraceae bacterium]|jgi:Fe-S-cluster containining protein|nr:hypothetical protein [Oscillospiraceae bacterium]